MSLLFQHSSDTHHTQSSSTDDEPLLGAEGEAIEGATLNEILRRQVHPTGERKRFARASYDVYRTCFESQILDGIRIQQNSVTIRQDMRRFLTKVRNDARDVTEQVAVVWDNGATRHVVDDDGSENEDATMAIRALAKEARFDIIAQMVNHLAWLQGPQFVVPMVRGSKNRRRLRADVISPHIYDIVQNEMDPLGMPVGLAWHIHHRHLAPHVHEDDVWVLDGFSLRRFRVRSSNAGGEPILETPVELLSDPIVHEHGVLPAALLRFTEPIAGDDWFLCQSNSRLTTGTIEIGVKMARMGLVRRAQNHRLLTVIGQIADMPKGQEKGDPEATVVAPTSRGTGSIDIDTHDYDTNPKNFIMEILFHVQCMIEPLGGHIQVDSGQPESFGKVEIPHEVQVEHRDRQIQPATDFEGQWWEASTLFAKLERLEEAIDLPEPEKVREGLRVVFGTLSRALKDPAAAQVHEDWRLSKGQTSEVGLMQEQLGGATAVEAQNQIEKNMLLRKWFNDFARANNLPLSMQGDVMTAPEANGAQGTPAREANRAVKAQGEGAEAGGPTAPEPT